MEYGFSRTICCPLKYEDDVSSKKKREEWISNR